MDDREDFLAEGFLFLGVEDRWPEELLGDQGGHERGRFAPGTAAAALPAAAITVIAVHVVG